MIMIIIQIFGQRNNPCLTTEPKYPGHVALIISYSYSQVADHPINPNPCVKRRKARAITLTILSLSQSWRVLKPWISCQLNFSEPCKSASLTPNLCVKLSLPQSLARGPLSGTFGLRNLLSVKTKTFTF